ncbi:MAG TPA: hypothetical protein VLH85_03830 [Levilinea sp.]|nr:hypothetical protein [Levilinea sp.]
MTVDSHRAATFGAVCSFLQHYTVPLALGISLRAGLSVWLAISWLLFLRDVSQYEMAIWQTYHHMPAHNTTLANAALGVWLRWDAVHYMNIAYFRYSDVGLGQMNLWPLFPYRVRFARLATGLDVTLLGLLITTAAAAGAMIFLFELVKSTFQDEQLARWTVLA